MSSNRKEDAGAGLNAEVVLGLADAQPRLFGFLLKRLVTRDQAQEVLQNVNLTICKKAHQFTPGTNFMSWAFAIARYELMTFRQVQAREKLVFSEDMAARIRNLDEELREDRSLDERRSALEICIRKLTAEQQELVNRRYTESTSVKAIAAEMDRTTNAVSLLMHRIREQLLGCINRQLASNIKD